MDLVEEYLRAVSLLLPRAQRDDIVAELRDTILSRIEAREEALGRKLADDETEAVLREIGHPLVVAARYREGPQHAVGPTLYPYWMFAVKAGVTIIAAVAALMLVIRLLGTGDLAYALGSALAPAIGGVITLVGICTIVAWIVERHGVTIGYLERWRVRDLKGLEVLAWDFETIREHFAGRRPYGPRPPPPPGPGGWPPPPSPGASSGPGWTPPPPPPSWQRSSWERRAEMRAARQAWRQAAQEARRHRDYRTPTAERALGAMVLGAVIILWWAGLVRFGLVGSADQVRDLGLDPGPLARVDWRTVREMLFWPVLMYGVAIICQGVVLWTHPHAVRIHGLVNLGIAVLVLGCVGWLWLDSPLAPAIHVDSLTGLIVQLKAAIDQPPPKPIGPFAALILLVVAIGAVGRAVHGLIQLLLGPPPELPMNGAAAHG